MKESFRRWVFDDNHKKRKTSSQRTYKKYSLDKLYDLVIESLKQGIGKHPTVDYRWYAEPIAIHLQVKTHEVKQVFHKLNLHGKSSKSKKWNSNSWSGCMHTRLDYGDQVVLWEANFYEVYLDKL